MAKIISWRWAEEDDPMFTGKVTISSKKSKIEPEEAKKENEDDWQHLSNIDDDI